MFDTLLRMWIKRKITAAKVNSAVAKGWIIAEQAEIILNTPQN